MTPGEVWQARARLVADLARGAVEVLWLVALAFTSRKVHPRRRRRRVRRRPVR